MTSTRVLAINGNPKGSDDCHHVVWRIERCMRELGGPVEFEYLFLKDLDLKHQAQ